jgi:hypothetical protein
MVGLLCDWVGKVRVPDTADEVQLQQFAWRVVGERMLLLGAQRRKHVPGHAGDDHTCSTRRDDRAELIENQCDTE